MIQGAAASAKGKEPARHSADSYHKTAGFRKCCIEVTFILAVLLLANLYVERYDPGALGIYYCLLLVALVANYAVPWHRLPASATTIGLLLSAAYCVPLFSAGVIFTQSFRRSPDRSTAFAANILGAVAGGLAQNFAFITGVKALLLVAALLYGGALACSQLRGTHQSVA